MPHPTPNERYDALNDMARDPQWLELVIECEKRRGPGSADRCGCNRAARWSNYCLWCWRETLAVAHGWK